MAFSGFKASILNSMVFPFHFQKLRLVPEFSLMAFLGFEENVHRLFIFNFLQ